MATITWTGAAGDGNYANPANWSPQQLPGASDTVVISPAAATTINVDNQAAGTLTTSKPVTLTIDNNTRFTLGNAGQTTTTFTNAGTVDLLSSGYNTDLVLAATKGTLTGGGSIVLSDNGNNRIYAVAGSDTLTNLNNTIEGAGQLGAGTLTFVNGTAGKVIADDQNALVVNTGTVAVINNGLMEATGPGGLVLQATIQNNSGGKVTAAGGNVLLQSATIAGGTLASSGGGAIIDQGSSTLDGSAHAVTNTGTVIVSNNTALSLLGTLNNTGTLNLQSSGYQTNLIAGPAAGNGTVTLTGGGTVLMSDNGNNRIYGAVSSDTLVNLNNTIAGAGEIGASQLVLVNDATIDATGGNALVIDPGNTVTNNGLMEATGAGGLSIQGTTIDNRGGGMMLAAGGNIILGGNATIVGGTLAVSGGGAFFEQNAATLDGSSQAVTNSGTIVDQNDTNLSLLGTLNNTGTLSLQSGGYQTNLIVGSAAGGTTTTLSGGGTVLMSDNGNNRIYGVVGSDTLVNLDNTISGAGEIGAGQLVLVNDSTIDATGSNALVIDPGGTVINDGLMEATGAGGLSIQNGTTIDNAGGGTMLAAGGTIYLLNGATIAGGTLASSGGGAFVEQNAATLDGSAQAVANTGTVIVSNNTSLNLLGTINNTGTLSMQSSGYQTNLIADPGVGGSTVTLTGGGTLLMSDNGNNRIYGGTATDTLVNLNNTISGAGEIGAGQLVLVNDATIDATGGNALVIDPGGTVTNHGLMEATGTGGLSIQNGTTINNAGGGTLLAASGNIYLSGGATIAGGTLSASGGGAFIETNVATLDGSTQTITNAATVIVANNTSLNLLGTINNTGTLSMQSSGYQTNLLIASPTVKLTGGGTLALSDNFNNRIYGTSTSNVLNNVNNTIEGAGQFGAGQLTLINGGTIEAVGGNVLQVNLGSTGSNSGAMIGAGSGGLQLINGTYTNTGTIEALNGSSVTFGAGATLTNDRNGVLSGGTYAAYASGNGATLALAGPTITTDAATIVLSGAGSTITAGGTALEASLAIIAATGALDLLAGRNFTDAKALTDRGVIALGGGTLAASAFSILAGGTLAGFGTVGTRLADTGTLAVNGGALTLTKGGSIAGAVSGTGSLVLSGGATTLASGATLTVAEVALINRANLSLGTPISFLGTLDIVGANAVSGGTLTNGGLMEQTGSGIATVSAPVVNTGTILIDAGGGFTFSGGLSEHRHHRGQRQAHGELRPQRRHARHRRGGQQRQHRDRGRQQHARRARQGRRHAEHERHHRHRHVGLCEYGDGRRQRLQPVRRRDRHDRRAGHGAHPHRRAGHHDHRCERHAHRHHRRRRHGPFRDREHRRRRLRRPSRRAADQRQRRQRHQHGAVRHRRPCGQFRADRGGRAQRRVQHRL